MDFRFEVNNTFLNKLVRRVAGECFEVEFLEEKNIYIKRYAKKICKYIFTGHNKTRTKDV